MQLAQIKKEFRAGPLKAVPHVLPKQVLVVDDDECIRELLRLHLANAGYHVLVAEDAVAAGRLVLKRAPDLMIIDVNMPYMDGFEFVSLVRAEKTIPFFPVIFLTAHADLGDRALALKATFLPKPIRADHLLAAVAAHAGQVNARSLGRSPL